MSWARRQNQSISQSIRFNEVLLWMGGRYSIGLEQSQLLTSLNSNNCWSRTLIVNRTSSKWVIYSVMLNAASVSPAKLWDNFQSCLFVIFSIFQRVCTDADLQVTQSVTFPWFGHARDSGVSGIQNSCRLTRKAKGKEPKTNSSNFGFTGPLNEHGCAL